MADLSLVQSIVIGVIEGLTEFLPVSSTAHMDIFPQLFGWDDPGSAFSAVIQLGPILAIIAYFRKDIAKYLKGMAKSPNPFKIDPENTDAKMGWYAILATPPVLLAGKLLEKKIDSSFRGLAIVAGALIVGSVVLWFAEQVGKRDKKMEAMTLNEAIIVGLAQAVALIPGISRSGATMTASLFLNFDRESATRFSFLLSIPALSAAGIYKLYKDVLHSPNLKALVLPYTVGTVVAGITAYAVIHWFLGYVRKHNTNVFIVYRIALGVAIVLMLGAGKLQSKAPEAVKPKEEMRLHTTTLLASK